MAQNRVSTVGTNFPDPSVQMVDSGGFITEEWRRFLQAIFTRTGSAAGVNAATIQETVIVNTTTIDSLQASFIEEIAGIPPQQPARNALLDLALAEIHNPRLPTGVGSYVSSTVLAGSAVPLTTAVAANITSIQLTPGDWDVTGSVAYNAAGSTVLSVAIGWTTATATPALPTYPNNGGSVAWVGTVPASEGPMLAVGSQRFVITRPTTIYLATETIFTTSTLSAYGFLGARRAALW